MTAFGQSVEPVHKRIKRILGDYPFGVGIVQELLQNADDAGANKVSLLFADNVSQVATEPVRCDHAVRSMHLTHDASLVAIVSARR
jgi:hypothetical protein